MSIDKISRRSFFYFALSASAVGSTFIYAISSNEQLVPWRIVTENVSLVPPIYWKDFRDNNVHPHKRLKRLQSAFSKYGYKTSGSGIYARDPALTISEIQKVISQDYELGRITVRGNWITSDIEETLITFVSSAASQ